MGEWGMPKDTPAGRKQFAMLIEARRRAEENQDAALANTDWCIGSEEFRRELLAQVSAKRGLWHYGPELQESAEDKAERLIAEERSRSLQRSQE